MLSSETCCDSVILSTQRLGEEVQEDIFTLYSEQPTKNSRPVYRLEVRDNWFFFKDVGVPNVKFQFELAPSHFYKSLQIKTWFKQTFIYNFIQTGARRLPVLLPWTMGNIRLRCSEHAGGRFHLLRERANLVQVGILFYIWFFND